MVLRKVGKILLLCIAGLLAVILLLMLAAKLALDRAPQYQAEIKDWVHDRIGYRIAFAHVSPAFRWYGPELYFEQLELRSKDGERVLAHAAGGRIGADLSQLFRGGRLFAARIELDAPSIVIERIAPDKFSLASEIELAGGGPSALPTMRLDDLPAGTLAIRQGLITIRNWNPALPQLELRNVDLNLHRSEGAATLGVDVQLPAVLGGTVRINGAARGPGRLDTVNWTAFARARDLKVAGWRQLVPEFLSRLAAGTGGFEMAARGQGPGLQRADLDFGAANVVTQLTDEPGVTFDQVTGA
ncbi:MAG: hypothetical protein QOD56_890, partial [Gammaproteobacteria bacterium]|nr:hypothetical protein [Gammaproteobacteria bacterium]